MKILIDTKDFIRINYYLENITNQGFIKRGYGVQRHPLPSTIAWSKANLAWFVANPWLMNSSKYTELSPQKSTALFLGTFLNLLEHTTIKIL